MGPTNALQFTGITLDTALMEAPLPEDKLAKCCSQLADFCSRKSVTLKEMQSLIGLLHFACCVVVPGRAFLRRLIDLTRGIRKPTHHVRLTKECKHDLNVWLRLRKTYQWVWTTYVDFSSEFCESHTSLIPVSVNNNSARKFASLTISTYVSTLRYVDKLANFSDPTKHFLVQKILAAHSKLYSTQASDNTWRVAMFSARVKSYQLIRISNAVVPNHVFGGLLWLFSSR